MKDKLIKELKNPNVKKALDLISIAEGTFNTPNPYLVKFGGELMKEDYSDAFTPKEFYYTDQNGVKRKNYSTATGKYQGLKKTWQEYSNKLGIDPKDLSPANQDLFALALIKDKGALDDVRNGDYHNAFSKLNDTWASLEGSKYGQPTHRTDELLKKYDQLANNNLINNNLSENNLEDKDIESYNKVFENNYPKSLAENKKKIQKNRT